MPAWDNLKGIPKPAQKKYIAFVKQKTESLLKGKVSRYIAFGQIQKERDKLERVKYR